MKQGSSRRGTFHEGVAPGAYHQENTRKKAEVEKDDFYFQEGNGQKKVWLNPGRLPHWEGPRTAAKCPMGDIEVRQYTGEGICDIFECFMTGKRAKTVSQVG